MTRRTIDPSDEFAVRVLVERVDELGAEHDELARRDGVELCDDELERDDDVDDVDDTAGGA